MVDDAGPRASWGKAVGDLDGDGLLDLLVGGHDSGELMWYRNPDWTRATIAEGLPFGTDHQIVDLDGDGRPDVVSLTNNQLIWYRGPDWSSTVIVTQSLHDIEAADLDGDGDVDLVGRDQSYFKGSGATVFLYEQDASGQWQASTLDAPEGEGLRLADLDADGRPDIVVNGVWYQNQGTVAADAWRPYRFTTAWDWPHSFIDVGDLDADGRLDIVLAPAEPAGGRYRLSWFEGPTDPTGPWPEHVVASDVETVMHFVGVADLDADGDLDIAAAEMHQGSDPDEIMVYLNADQGHRWRREVVADTGSHSMQIADLDHDGDNDLFGANWDGEEQSIEVWDNTSCAAAAPWQAHVLGLGGIAILGSSHALGSDTRSAARSIRSP